MSKKSDDPGKGRHRDWLSWQSEAVADAQWIEMFSKRRYIYIQQWSCKMIDWRSSKFRLIGSALTADTGALQKLNTSFELNENFCFEFKKER